MTGNTGNGSTFARMVAAWNDFFFRPRDPSTLCLMRVMTGIFVLYVHVAYTWDLYNFFGPHGLANLEMVNDIRRNSAVGGPQWSWDESRQNILVPVNHEEREALFGWAKTLPENANDRKTALAYFVELKPDLEASNQALGFAERFIIRTDDDAIKANRSEFRFTKGEEREQMMGYLTRLDVSTVPLDVLPTYMRELSFDERKEIGHNLNMLAATFQGRPAADVAMIFQHLMFQAMIPSAIRNPNDPLTEFQRSLRFFTEKDDPKHRSDSLGVGPYMPDEATERARVLDYLSRWTVDPRLPYAKGMYTWSIWYHVTNPTAMGLIHAGILVVMTLFALGLFTRVTAVITWIAALNYIQRNSYILFGQDTMMNLCLIYMVLAPSGATLSLDRWLEKRRARRDLEKAKKENRDTREFEAILAGPRPSSLANLVTRLVQIHFCFIYTASGLSKLKGPAWWNHTAMWYTVMNPEFSPTVFGPYMYVLRHIVTQRWLVELLMSFGAIYTIFLEISFGFLVWRPRLRPYMVMMAILLHTGIAVMMGLTLFGLFMMTLLLSYIPPETVKQWLELGEKRLRSGSAEPAIIPAPARVVAKV